MTLPTRRVSFAVVAMAIASCTGVDRAPTSPLMSGAPPVSVSTASPNGAGVYINLAGACGMFDGNGNGVFPLDAQVNVVTESRNGNAVHNCYTDVENTSGRAIRYDAFDNPLGTVVPCTIFDPDGTPIVTLTFHEQISASGKAHLICVARPQR